jgi:hypothetical protein
MKKVLFLFIFGAMGTAAMAQTTTKLNKPLADSLASLIETDQIISSGPKPNKGRFANMDAQQWNAYKDSVHTNHKEIAEKIFNRYGFPGYDLVGKTGSKHFWLVVQHSDKYPDFQQRVLAGMKKELDRKNADAIDYAYLTDRVLLHTGKKQLYGTQVLYNGTLCQAYPKPVADSAALDARRKKVGLEPIRVYLNEISQVHFDMNAASYKSQGIDKPKLYPLTD